MKILAAIITHNRCELLERCINHLQKQTRLPDSILVVNNGSTDATVDMLMRRNIRYITQENLGSAGGWNRCLSHALEHHFDAVWLMDDDGFPNPSALQRLESKLVTGRACVSSVVLRENDRERLVFPFPILNDKKLPITWRRKLKKINNVLSVCPSGLYPFVSFFNGSLISCDAIKKVGNVDKDFFIYGEEVDYLYRLRSVGKVLTDMTAHHYHPNVNERTWSDLKIYYYTKNTIILNRRYLNMVWLRNIIAVVATFYRIALHNGWKGVISYLYRNNLKTLLISIWRGLNGRVAKDFPDHVTEIDFTVKTPMKNIDIKVVEDFGVEWERFQQFELPKEELETVWNSYFGIFPIEELDENSIGFDMGCGSGRWAKFIASKVGTLTCVDPSKRALGVAERNLSEFSNVNFINASVGDDPLEEKSQDFGFCLGVLHHVPDTPSGIKSCAITLKQNAPFLIYLYYNFEDSSSLFKYTWKLSDLLRRVISILPSKIKVLAAALISFSIYFPLARLALILERLGVNVKKMPLSYYRDRHYYFMRTDALDRFGTRLEKRFSRQDVTSMMIEAGFTDIQFSDKRPYWVCLARKK